MLVVKTTYETKIFVCDVGVISLHLNVQSNLLSTWSSIFTFVNKYISLSSEPMCLHVPVLNSRLGLPFEVLTVHMY